MRWLVLWLRRTLVVGVLLLAVPPAVLAQGPTLGERRFDFNFSAQPLGEALRRFTGATGVEVRYAPDLVVGKQAPAVSGVMTAGEALGRLLAGTGLTFRTVGPAAVAVMTEAQARGEPVEGRLELDPVTVLGTRRAGAPLSNVPASITTVDEPEIRKELATTGRIEDVLKRQVPGFNPNNEGVRKIRGRTAQVFINGVPTNEQIRASRGSDLNLVLPEQLTRIEVSRGANAAYGFGSPGGIIALSTPRADSERLTFRTRVSESFNPHRVKDSHQTVLYQSVSQIVRRFDYHLGGAVAYDGIEFDREGRRAQGFDNAALLINAEEVIGGFDTSLGYDLRELGRVRLVATFNHVDFWQTHRLIEGVYRGPFGRLEKQPRGDESFRTNYTVNVTWEHDQVLAHALKLEAFTSDTFTRVFREIDPILRDEEDNTYYGVRSSATLPLDRLTGGVLGGLFKGTALTYGFDVFRNDYARPVWVADTGELDTWIAPPVTLKSPMPRTSSSRCRSPGGSG